MIKEKLKQVLNMDKDASVADIICELDEKLEKEALCLLQEKQLQRMVNWLFLKELKRDLEKQV